MSCKHKAMMNCSICHSSVQPGWHFCRWCGTALNPLAGAPTLAKTNALDTFLGSFLTGAQSDQAPSADSQNSLSDIEYINYLNAGIVPGRR